MCVCMSVSAHVPVFTCLCVRMFVCVHVCVHSCGVCEKGVFKSL